MKRIAIIGAGFSGLTLAQVLSIKAEEVVFEKARGVCGA
jgi:predicted NAD/FAD-dependent oxidoreductase